MKGNIGGVRHDYKDRAPAAPARRRWLLFALGLSIPLGVVSLVVLGTPRAATVAPPSISIVATPPATIALPAALDSIVDTTVAESSAAEIGTMLDLLVRRGDTLETLFRRNGLSLTDLAAMVALPNATTALRLLKPGDRLEIAHRDGQVVSLRRELDEIRILAISRDAVGFKADTLERTVDIRTASASGTIESSLFEAGALAGISDRTTMDMAGIFEWDIDFIQDVREGDRFALLYEELWRDGIKLRDGEIIAAEFINQGRSFRAARFRDPDGKNGYYTPDGRSVRKAFIRAPLNFTRISSNFNPSRRHPVLNTIRAHRGVDYSAPTGTPIRAAGEGKVLFRGAQGGYGNTVVLQHGGNITTLYGHLSRFGSFRVGARVSQGDVIGYVGSSGLATGPHLHYEYRISGVHRNPRTVTLPPADPISAAHQTEFQAATEPLWRWLDNLTQVTTARTTTPIDAALVGQIGPPIAPTFD